MAFAFAAGNFDDGFFDDAVAAGVLAGCVASCDNYRFVGTTEAGRSVAIYNCTV